MKIRPIFAWYDLWVGAFWDSQKRRLYILPLPCVGVVVEFSVRRSETEIKRLNAALDEVIARANQPSAGETELLTKISDMHRIARYARLPAPALTGKESRNG